MRPGKVFTLLFGLAQLVLFLKLIELVQGASGSAVELPAEGTTTEQQATFRHLADNGPVDLAWAADAVKLVLSAWEGISKVNSKERSSNSTDDAGRDQNLARGCPACTGAEDCNANVQSMKYYVPFIELKIAAIAGLLWLIFYFKVWRFPKHRPEQPSSGYPAPAVGGYGGYSSGGYPSPAGGYDGYPSSDAGYSGDPTDGGVLDTVMRAIEKFSQ